MLSETSINLLNDNGYKVQQSKDLIVIKRSDSDRYVIGCIGILLVIGSFIVMGFSWILGLAILAGSIFVLLKSGKKTTGKSSLTLHLNEQWFESIEERWGRMARRFEDATEITFYSKFYDEYSSANKSTTEEYTHDIILKLNSNHKIRLFRFEGSYSEPSEEENELLDQLKEIFKTPISC